MRSLLRGKKRLNFDALPSEIDEHTRNRFFTLSPAALKLIATKRGDHNKPGFAVQLIFYNAAHLQAIRKAMQALHLPFTDEYFQRVWPTMTWDVNSLGDFLFAKSDAFDLPLHAIPVNLKPHDPKQATESNP